MRCFRFEDCIAASEDFGMTSTSFETLYSLMVMGFKRQVGTQRVGLDEAANCS